MKGRLAVAAAGAAVALAIAGLATAQPGAAGGKNASGRSLSSAQVAQAQAPTSAVSPADVDACIDGASSIEVCASLLSGLPSDDPSYADLVFVVMIGEIEAGRPVQAISYGDMIAAQRTGPAAELVRCMVRVLARWDLDAGLAACNAADTADPGVIEQRGRIHLMAARWSDAWNDFDAAYQGGEGAQSLFLRGLAAAGRGKMADAVRDMAQAEEEAPGTTQSFEDTGFSLAAVMTGKPLAPPEAFAPMVAAVGMPRPHADLPSPQKAPQPEAKQSATIRFAPDAPRGQVALLSDVEASACMEEVVALRNASQGWKGTPAEIAQRLGLMQRTIFAGRCAGHPNAAALVAEADQEIAASAASAASAFTDAQDTTPDAISCVEPMAPNNPRNRTGSPALHNACNFPVEVAYCNVSPARGSWAEMFACGVRGSLGMEVIPANGATPAVFGREVQHFACREPSGPVLTHVAAKGLDGFCK